MRQYTVLMEEGHAEQPNDIRTAQRRTRPDEIDVPFGVRAIESGVEVEGVWISRPNTPMPGSPVLLASARSPSSPTLRATTSEIAPPPPLSSEIQTARYPKTRPAYGSSEGVSASSRARYVRWAQTMRGWGTDGWRQLL